MKNRFLLISIATCVVAFFLGILIGRATTIRVVQYNQSPKILSQKNINKSFSFDLSSDTNKQTFTYTIQSATTQKEIILKGERADAVQGKAFFIVNLAITNPSDKEITITSRNYIRLQINKNADLLAADIHNDPVIIQPISTKYTRLGFTIDDAAHDFTLLVGALDQKKTPINVKLK